MLLEGGMQLHTGPAVYSYRDAVLCPSPEFKLKLWLCHGYRDLDICACFLYLCFVCSWSVLISLCGTCLGKELLIRMLNSQQEHPIDNT